jgi:glycosyltransferase involved in cell wall biosynthesis
MKDSQTKVALVSHWSSQGGAERSLYDVATCLRSSGIDVIALFPNTGSMTRRFEAQRIQTYTSSYRWWTGRDISLVKRVARNLWTLVCLPRVAWIVANARCDVVYTNTSTIWIGAAVARVLGLPHIWHIHEYGWDTFGFRWDLGQTLSLWCIRAGSHVVLFNSRTTAEKYREYGTGLRGQVLYQGFELPEPPPDAGHLPDSLVVRLGVVGFVNEQKRQLDVIDALGILSKRGLRVILRLIGQCEAAYREDLLSRAEALGVRDLVEFLGFVDSATEIYPKFDILVVPALGESFGRVTVEAMLWKKLVVAANSGANTELIRDRETGFLFSGGDPIQLAQVLQEVVEDRAVREAVTEVAYLESRRLFGMDSMRHQLVELVSKLTGHIRRVKDPVQ